MTNTLNLDDISAIAISGGDGTIHEAINGMLNRQDGQQRPLILVPNGTGNDNCQNIECHSVDQAIEYMHKGDLI